MNSFIDIAINLIVFGQGLSGNIAYSSHEKQKENANYEEEVIKIAFCFHNLALLIWNELRSTFKKRWGS